MRKFFYVWMFYLVSAMPVLAVDLTQPIRTFDGKDFTDEHGGPAPQTLGIVIENSLLATVPGLSDDEKNKRYWLAHKLHAHATDYTPTPEEMVLIEKVLHLQPIAIMGQAISMLDPTYVPGDK